MPLSAKEKVRFYKQHLIPIANQIRKIERLAVEHASYRLIEVTTNCLHVLSNDLRKDAGLPFRESDIEPSVYGESGDPKP